ncbi:MAG: protein-L-isoaspartate O-methyltransferase [Pseudomonadota bacterium]
MAELSVDLNRSARVVLTLRRRGVTDNGVLKALETVSRAAFLDPDLEHLAFELCPLPAPCGQTAFTQETAGHLLQACEFGEGVGKALVVGAGCGYLPALVAEFATQVFAVERFARMAAHAERAFGDLGADTIALRVGDGLTGWAEHAPFDRILLTGAVDEAPEALLGQLSPGGRLTAWVGAPDSGHLTIVDANGGQMRLPARLDLPSLIAGPASAL